MVMLPEQFYLLLLLSALLLSINNTSMTTLRKFSFKPHKCIFILQSKIMMIEVKIYEVRMLLCSCSSCVFMLTFHFILHTSLFSERKTYSFTFLIL